MDRQGAGCGDSDSKKAKQQIHQEGGNNTCEGSRTEGLVPIHERLIGDPRSSNFYRAGDFPDSFFNRDTDLGGTAVRAKRNTAFNRRAALMARVIHAEKIIAKRRQKLWPEAFFPGLGKKGSAVKSFPACPECEHKPTLSAPLFRTALSQQYAGRYAARLSIRSSIPDCSSHKSPVRNRCRPSC